MTGSYTPLVTFLEFTDSRQLMLRRFAGQLARLSVAETDPAVRANADSIFWPLDNQGLIVGRLLGLNRREVARTARIFSTLEKARRTTSALIAAGDRLTTHLARSGAGFTWFLSLYGAPALVGVQRFETEEEARDSAALARRQVAAALVSASSRKLHVAGTGPLSIDARGTHRFSFSHSGNPRPENEVPVSNQLDTGTRG
ncbi:hypothetical protein SAMN06295879_0306 [Agreia bicolorata]|uniref:Uncharacterized protein n=1 Tax=Agreia bicolorata TaxID=110935 RepID=A0A1T4WVY3_9MICO|nr:hypothetical protein [Agreia bicolorata]SKA81287.1 hypothetical protein SAMN06295879_0306 [Agreia bicolorata]